MRYFAQSNQNKHQGGNNKQKCRIRKSVNAGEAIEATRLRSPVLRDPCFLRVDVQPSDTVERGEDASGKADNL